MYVQQVKTLRVIFFQPSAVRAQYSRKRVGRRKQNWLCIELCTFGQILSGSDYLDSPVKMHRNIINHRHVYTCLRCYQSSRNMQSRGRQWKTTQYINVCDSSCFLVSWWTDSPPIQFIIHLKFGPKSRFCSTLFLNAHSSLDQGHPSAGITGPSCRSPDPSWLQSLGNPLDQLVHLGQSTVSQPVGDLFLDTYPNFRGKWTDHQDLRVKSHMAVYGHAPMIGFIEENACSDPIHHIISTKLEAELYLLTNHQHYWCIVGSIPW